MSSMPLRVRLVGVVVLLSALALTLSGVAASTALRGFLLERLDSQLTATAGRVAQELPYQNGSNGNGYGNNRPDPLTDGFFEVFDGTTIIRSMLHSGVSGPNLPATLNAQQAAFTVPSIDGRHTWRVQISQQNTALVIVALPLDGVDATMSRLVMLEVVGGAVVIVLLAGVGYVIVRRSLRPLAEVEVAAEVIAAGDLSQRVPEGHPRTEVGSLSRSFNSMVAQIETSFTAQVTSQARAEASEEQMRRFVADASHELRTPLTSIRGFAELYRQGALPAGQDVDRAMSRVESEAQRMGLLIDDLLLLARMDQQRPIDRIAVDLVGVAANAVQDAQAAAPTRQLRLQADVETCTVQGDAGRLAQVLGNLLTNAVAHTSSDARVVLRVADDGEQALIEVIDNGPGISEADKAHLFERFYRADVSRTRASGGSGLGLSIVAGIVDAHGGTVEVADTAGGGATFRVRLPLLVPVPAPVPA